MTLNFLIKNLNGLAKEKNTLNNKIIQFRQSGLDF